MAPALSAVQRAEGRRIARRNRAEGRDAANAGLGTAAIAGDRAAFSCQREDGQAGGIAPETWP